MFIIFLSRPHYMHIKYSFFNSIAKFVLKIRCLNNESAMQHVPPFRAACSFTNDAK